MATLAKPIKIPCERKPGHLHAFFALKFHTGDQDHAKVTAIETALNQAGIEITLMARDAEKWGEAEIPTGKTLMPDYAFPTMLQCDCNIIEFSEKGVGLGINAGFCYASHKPIYLIAKTGSDISPTIAELAQEIIFYNQPEDLIVPFTKIAKNFPRVILASGSPSRKRQLELAGIPFEVLTSHADETPDQSKSLKDQLAEIALLKAQAVFEKTKNRGRRLIIAADQNIMFDAKLYGKQKTLEDARNLLRSMRGTDTSYSYTGNAIILADGDKILQSLSLTDTARTIVDDLSDAAVEEFLSLGTWDKVCGVANVNNASFVHVKSGRLSTAQGMTLEYAQEFLKNLVG